MTFYWYKSLIVYNISNVKFYIWIKFIHFRNVTKYFSKIKLRNIYIFLNIHPEKYFSRIKILQC